MIREYQSGDEIGTDFNEFSKPETAPEVFADDSWKKYTIEDGGVKIIACFQEVAPKTFATFLLMAKDVGNSHCRELKRLLNDVTMKLKPERVLTYSHDCDVINRWHEFLGFKIEESLLMGDKKFNKWVMTWA